VRIFVPSFFLKIVNKFLHFTLKSEKQNFIDKGKAEVPNQIFQQGVIKSHELLLPSPSNNELLL
jgi:hypothetical protein